MRETMCPKCRGLGLVADATHREPRDFWATCVPCPKCGGAGKAGMVEAQAPADLGRVAYYAHHIPPNDDPPRYEELHDYDRVRWVYAADAVAAEARRPLLGLLEEALDRIRRPRAESVALFLARADTTLKEVRSDGRPDA